MCLFESFPPSGIPRGELSEAFPRHFCLWHTQGGAQRSGVEKSVLHRFLHFGLLCGPTVEITKVQIIITIGIRRAFCSHLKSERGSEHINRTAEIEAGVFLVVMVLDLEKQFEI